MAQSQPKGVQCPFCGAKVPRPGPVDRESYEGSEGGACVCSAAFALDATGHHLGRAMLDAYCFAVGSPDLALDLDPAEDLDEAVIKGYDPQRHVVMPPQSPRFTGPCLYFVRLRPGAAARLAGKGNK